MLEDFWKLCRSLVERFRKGKTIENLPSGQVSRGLLSLEEDTANDFDFEYSRKDYCCRSELLEEDFDLDFTCKRSAERFFRGAIRSNTSFSSISFQRSSAISESRTLSPRERAVSEAHLFAPKDPDEPVRCWGRVATLGKLMSENMIGIGFVARLYLARMKKQQEIKDKRMLFLMESMCCLGLSDKDDFPARLNDCISQFETALNALETAFQNGDAEKCKAARAKLVEVSSLLPVHVRVWCEWYEYLKQAMAKGKDESCLMMSQDEFQTIKKAVDGYASEWNDLAWRLVMFNLGLGISVANAAKIASDNIWEDTVSSSRMMLRKAVERFDYTRGLTFSTYAMYILKHWVKTHLAEAKMVSVPDRERILLAKIQARIVEYEIEYQISPTEAFLAEALNVSEKVIHKVLTNAKVNVFSADSPVDNNSDDEGGCLTEILVDPGEVPSELIDEAEKHKALLLAIGSLPKQQRTVLVLYYGLYDSPKPNISMSSTEIARRLGLSNGRVTELRQTALKNIRSKMSAYMR